MSFFVSICYFIIYRWNWKEKNLIAGYKHDSIVKWQGCWKWCFTGKEFDVVRYKHVCGKIADLKILGLEENTAGYSVGEVLDLQSLESSEVSLENRISLLQKLDNFIGIYNKFEFKRIKAGWCFSST